MSDTAAIVSKKFFVMLDKITQTLGVSNRNLIDRLKDSENKTYRIGIKVQRTIPNQNNLDARTLTFYNLAIVRRSSTNGSTQGIIIHNNHGQLNKDYDQITLTGYTQALFSIIDSKFRLFTTASDPKACNDATDSFYTIYHWFLDELGKTQQYENFLTFFSHIRNAIHNNGRHMNKKHLGKSITYRRKTYNFVYGQSIIYSDPYELTPGVIDMMEDIILHSKILGLNSVPDPMA